MGKVSIVRTGDGVGAALAGALELIGGLGAFVKAGDVVMLKPNINGMEGVTSPELVESLLNLLKDMGLKRLVIAEATFGNERMTDMFFAKSGYTELAKRYGVGLINLNRSQAVPVPVKKPHVKETLHIAREVFEADRIINMPVMKVHYATGITLALKNLKGLLVLDEKRRFHEIGLEAAIVDLNNTVKPALNVVDAIRCMERMGPRGGDMVDLNLLLAGADSAEVDYVGMAVMEHDLEDVKHLKLHMEDNGIDPAQIEVVGLRVDDVKYPFRKARLSVAMPPDVTVHESDACSSCMNALLLSFEILAKEFSDPVQIFLGRKTNPDQAGPGLRVAFGNCCDPKNGRFDLAVKGCPPYPFELRDKLSQRT
jgi:uncharacterized protein (DUF362 family)